MLDRLLRGLERRNAPELVYPRPALGTMFPFRFLTSATGANVTADTAMELVPVYGAVAMLAGAIGSLPLKVYRDAEPRVEARGSRQWRILHDQPNEEMSADEFWEVIMTSLLLWGNAFVYKQRDPNGVVQELWPIRPSRVQVGREVLNGESVRFFQLDNNLGTKAYETDILHLRGLSTDGLVGLSPIQQARQQIANDQAHQEFLGKFLKNGMFASAVYTHPNKLTNDAHERLATQIGQKSGWLEAGTIPILEEGGTLSNLTMPLEDAQFVEQANLSDHRIAQLFGLVPPHQWGVGAGGRSMTYQNSEFGGLEFVKWSVRKWLIRIESSLRRDPGLFPSPGPVLFPEFVVDALLRSDTLSRYQAYQIAVDTGFMSVGQVQQLENIEPDDTQLEGTVAEPLDAGSPPAVAPPAEAPALSPGTRNAAEALPETNTRTLQVLDDLRGIFRPEIRVEAPQLPPIYVDVPRQLPPDVLTPVNVTVDLQPVADALAALGDTVREAAARDQDAPVINVNVPPQPAPVVNVQLADDQPEQLQIDFQRNSNGTIKSATVTEA